MKKNKNLTHDNMTNNCENIVESQTIELKDKHITFLKEFKKLCDKYNVEQVTAQDKFKPFKILMYDEIDKNGSILKIIDLILHCEYSRLSNDKSVLRYSYNINGIISGTI